MQLAVQNRTTTLASVAIGILTLVVLLTANASSRWGADYFPSTALMTQNGKSVRFYDDLIKGKIVAIDLVADPARLRQLDLAALDDVGPVDLDLS